MAENQIKNEVTIRMEKNENDKEEDEADDSSIISEGLDYEFLRNFYNEARKRKTSVIQRPPMNQIKFDEEFVYKKVAKKNQFKKKSGKLLTKYYAPFTSCSKFSTFLMSIFPIIDWLPKYDWKSSLSADIIGGITVGVMHVPQGIAYAVLSKQEPIIGLYTSIFPALIYMVFGTSRHASIGSFAIVALMNGIAVGREAFISTDQDSENLQNLPQPIEVSCTLILTVGLIQFLMGFFRLQFLTTYLSDQVVAGFTTGAAVHVLIAQLKDLFGLKGLPKHNGPGYLIKTIIELATNISKTNLMTFAISLVSILILNCGKEYINPVFKRLTKTNIPIPWELVVVILSTIFVALTNGHEKFNVQVVNKIPTGFPELSLPRLDLIPNILPDAISIAMVTVAVHLSLSKMLAKRMNYELDAGQELFAIGLSSIGGSFFPVYPVSCALGRTMVGVEGGVATQLHNVFSSLLVLSVSLYFGKFMETLPMAVLSAIVVIALKGMFKKLGDVKNLWRISKIDFWIWFVSFFATIFVDVSEGLIIAVLFALFTTILREQYPKWHLLANVKGTSEFRAENNYQETLFYKGICIFRFDAPLLFYNVECFKKCVEKAYDEWKKSHEFYVLKEERKEAFEIELSIDRIVNGTTRDDQILSRHFIIDCSGFTFIDLMGVSALKEVFSDMRKKGIQVYLAHTKAPVREMFEKCDFFKFVPKDNLYPTLRDATAIARQRQNQLGVKDTKYVLEHDRLSEYLNSLPDN